MNKNYTSVCCYCGEVYQSNRITSKFCSSAHRSLYHKNGPQIQSTIMDKNGVYMNVDERLSQIDYNLVRKDPDGWSYAYNLDSIIYKYCYEGPLPKGDELLVVGSYLIVWVDNPDELFYAVKHISKLTIKERATNKIIRATV